MKTEIIGLTLLATMLAACGSAKDANNSNFEKAINKHFAKDCITVQPFVFGADSRTYPITFVLKEKNSYSDQAQIDQSNSKMTQPLDLLTNVGLLSVSDGTKQVKPMFSNTEVTAPTKIYSLTELGKKSLASAESTAMCVGHYKVDEVVRFTEPNNAMGQTISQVSVIVSPVDVPAWSKNVDILKAYRLDEKLAERRKVTRTLVLASDGWIDSRDFSR